MKKHWQFLVLLVGACLTFAPTAMAIPVVATGSTYSIYIEGTESDNATLGTFTFDGIPESIPRAGGMLAAVESETLIDANSSRIIITLSSDRDLFPDPNDVALLGIGTLFGDGLDLLFPVRLVDARLFFIDTANQLITETGNLASQAVQNNPWDGLFPAIDDLVGIGDIGGRNVQTVSFQFIVSNAPVRVPEPGIMLLSGIGLLALAAARRRKMAARSA